MGFKRKSDVKAGKSNKKSNKKSTANKNLKKIKELDEIKRITKLNNLLKSADLENTILSSSGGSSGEDTINENVIENILDKAHKNINDEDKYIDEFEEKALKKEKRKKSGSKK